MLAWGNAPGIQTHESQSAESAIQRLVIEQKLQSHTSLVELNTVPVQKIVLLLLKLEIMLLVRCLCKGCNFFVPYGTKKLQMTSISACQIGMQRRWTSRFSHGSRQMKRAFTIRPRSGGPPRLPPNTSLAGGIPDAKTAARWLGLSENAPHSNELEVMFFVRR
jgi:hypothetical protein